MTNKPEQLTADELDSLKSRLTDGAGFYFENGRRPGASMMAELLTKAAKAVTELQERRKADSTESVSFDELNAAVAEVTGGNQHAWDANIYKGHQEVPFMNYNSLARIVDKYRVPQPAPVVQPVMFINGDISASDAEKLAAVIREWDDAPAPERDQVRRDHAAWSQATFGNVGPVGPLKHLSKEALEAAAEPGDLSEWADMQFLLWDAQRRAGISDEQINQAMVEKLAINKQREWPEPKDGEPRQHIKTDQQQEHK